MRWLLTNPAIWFWILIIITFVGAALSDRRQARQAGNSTADKENL